MITIKTHTGILNRYLFLVLQIDSTTIDLGPFDEEEAGRLADEFQDVANDLRTFANRNKEE